MMRTPRLDHQYGRLETMTRTAVAFLALLALPLGARAQSVSNNGMDQPIPGTSGGLSQSSLQVAANTTSVAIKATAGQLYGIEAFNNSATIAYIKIYNATQGSTTCGSGTPVYRAMIPSNSTSGAGYISQTLMGVSYATAITVCVTTGFADNDSGAPAATTYIVNTFFK